MTIGFADGSQYESEFEMLVDRKPPKDSGEQQVVSDEQPDGVEAGQQYAMMNKKPGQPGFGTEVDKYITLRGGGGRSGVTEMRNPANSNVNKPYDPNFKSSNVEERKANMAQGIKEGKLTPEGQIVETPAMREFLKTRFEELRNRLLGPETRRSMPDDVVRATKKLDNLGFDRPGQAVSAIREDYKQGGLELVKKRWDIGTGDEMSLGRIIKYIKDNP